MNVPGCMSTVDYWVKKNFAWILSHHFSRLTNQTFRLH